MGTLDDLSEAVPNSEMVDDTLVAQLPELAGDVVVTGDMGALLFDQAGEMVAPVYAGTSAEECAEAIAALRDHYAKVS